MSMAEKERRPRHVKKGRSVKRTLQDRHGEREAKREISNRKDR